MQLFEYISNISSEMNKKLGKYQEISEKSFVKTLTKNRKFTEQRVTSVNMELFFYTKGFTIQNTSAMILILYNCKKRNPETWQ